MMIHHIYNAYYMYYVCKFFYFTALSVIIKIIIVNCDDIV